MWPTSSEVDKCIGATWFGGNKSYISWEMVVNIRNSVVLRSHRMSGLIGNHFLKQRVTSLESKLEIVIPTVLLFIELLLGIEIWIYTPFRISKILSLRIITSEQNKVSSIECMYIYVCSVVIPRLKLYKKREVGGTRVRDRINKYSVLIYELL